MYFSARYFGGSINDCTTNFLELYDVQQSNRQTLVSRYCQNVGIFYIQISICYYPYFKIDSRKCIFQDFHMLSFQDAPANHIGASNRATIRFVTNANNTAIWRAKFQVSTQNGV